MIDAPYCPVCPHGSGVHLGRMGMHDHYRCCNCGIDWTLEVMDPEDDDCDDDGRFSSDAEADEDTVSGEQDDSGTDY